MKKLLVSMLLLLSGCANIANRNDGRSLSPYQCTCEMAASVAAPFRRATGPEGQIAKAYLTLLLPVSVVSLPLDAVLDTVFLPWDMWTSSGTKQTEERL